MPVSSKVITGIFEYCQFLNGATYKNYKITKIPLDIFLVRINVSLYVSISLFI